MEWSNGSYGLTPNVTVGYDMWMCEICMVWLVVWDSTSMNVEMM